MMNHQQTVFQIWAERKENCTKEAVQTEINGNKEEINSEEVLRKE